MTSMKHQALRWALAFLAVLAIAQFSFAEPAYAEQTDSGETAVCVVLPEQVSSQQQPEESRPADALPKTGDETCVALLLACALASGAGCAALFRASALRDPDRAN